MPPGSHSNRVPRMEKMPLTTHIANHFSLVLKLRDKASRSCVVRPCSLLSWTLRTHSSFSTALLLGHSSGSCPAGPSRPLRNLVICFLSEETFFLPTKFPTVYVLLTASFNVFKKIYSTVSYVSCEIIVRSKVWSRFRPLFIYVWCLLAI